MCLYYSPKDNKSATTFLPIFANKPLPLYLFNLDFECYSSDFSILFYIFLVWKHILLYTCPFALVNISTPNAKQLFFLCKMYGITDIYSTFIEPNPDNPMSNLNEAGTGFIASHFSKSGLLLGDTYYH